MHSTMFNTSVIFKKFRLFITLILMSTLLMALTHPNQALAQTAPNQPGALIRTDDGTVWRITPDGLGRQSFDSAERFHSHRFDFGQVLPATVGDINLPYLGIIDWGDGVVFNDQGTIYVVTGGMKHGFVSEEVYLGQGYTFDQAIPGDLSVLEEGDPIIDAGAKHLDGTFVVDDQGTAWLMTSSGRTGVDSPEVLFSHNVEFDDLITASSADLSVAAEGEVLPVSTFSYYFGGRVLTNTRQTCIVSYGIVTFPLFFRYLTVGTPSRATLYLLNDLTGTGLNVGIGKIYDHERPNVGNWVLGTYIPGGDDAFRSICRNSSSLPDADGSMWIMGTSLTP